MKRGAGANWLLLGLLASLTASRPAAADDFVILVSKTNRVGSLTRSDLKRVINGGTKQWGNGAVVQLGIIPADAPETQYFASLVDLSSRELLARIQEQIFKGELRRPAVLRSSADCAAFARAYSGAICVAASGTPVPPEAQVVPIS
jgi:ABC-type phosphate transport system substrate-binding protein